MEIRDLKSWRIKLTRVTLFRSPTLAEEFSLLDGGRADCKVACLVELTVDGVIVALPDFIRFIRRKESLREFFNSLVRRLAHPSPTAASSKASALAGIIH